MTTLLGGTTPVQDLPAGTATRGCAGAGDGIALGSDLSLSHGGHHFGGHRAGRIVSFVAKDSTDPTGHPTAKPDVTTEGVVNVTDGSADLLGSVNPNGGTTVVQFEYGTTDSYGV